MSISHPFLKQIKGHVQRFCADKVVRDDHSSLQAFCRTLEEALKNGLRDKSYWQWIVGLLETHTTRELTSSLQFCIEYAKESKKVLTDVGKARLFLRCSLNKAVLAHSLILLRRNRRTLYDFYDDISIVGDDILSEMFLSLLAPLEAHVQFRLNVRVGSFLDESWQLPVLRRYELVPCARLGVELCSVRGRVVVLSVEAESVADEDMKVEPGDLLDDLFGEPLRNATVNKCSTLLSDYRGSPIYVSVVKCLNADGSFFRPLLPYLEAAGLSREVVAATRRRRLDEQRDLVGLAEGGGADDGADAADEGGLARVSYCGRVNVGGMGSVEQIETGVTQALKLDKAKRDVLVDLGETDVTVTCAQTNAILIQHGYPEIASCGRRIDLPLNFSYIAGETTCTLARRFHCYVFEAQNDAQAKAILKRIAEGFERTHWAV